MMKLSLQDNMNKLILLVTMTAIWTTLYALVHIFYRPDPKTSKSMNKKIILDTKNRIISIVHGVSSFVMAAISFLTEEFK